MLAINVEEKAKRVEIVVSREPDRGTWTETVLGLAVQIQGLNAKQLECFVDISSLESLSAYSKERIFALRDLFLRQGFRKVTFHVASVGEAMRMTHKRRAEVMAGAEEYLFAA
jgi:hypothetical protein